MKIYDTFSLSKNLIFTSKNNESSKSNNRGSSNNIFINLNGDRCKKFYIFDKEYIFKLTDDMANDKIPNKMVDNIRKTMTGYFVRSMNKEYFIPHILDKTPHVLRQSHVIKYGNVPTERNEESKAAFKIINSCTKAKLDIKNLKTIKYLHRPINGYSNNVVEKAYSYSNISDSTIYLYIPKENRMQILSSDNHVKDIRFDN